MLASALTACGDGGRSQAREDTPRTVTYDGSGAQVAGAGFTLEAAVVEREVGPLVVRGAPLKIPESNPFLLHDVIVENTSDEEVELSDGSTRALLGNKQISASYGCGYGSEPPEADSLPAPCIGPAFDKTIGPGSSVVAQEMALEIGSAGMNELTADTYRFTHELEYRLAGSSTIESGPFVIEYRISPN